MAGLDEQPLAVGVGRQHRAVAGQRQAQRLGQAVHRIGGEHARAGAAGRAGGALDDRDVGVADLVVGRRHHGVDQVDACVSPVESLTLPASIGPPETKTAGMLSRSAAISMPGVILSQLEMQTSASAQWALTMYSTLSAMISREGRRIEHAVVAHGDAVVDGDGVEFLGDAAGRLDLARHQLAEVLQMDVARARTG